MRFIFFGLAFLGALTGCAHRPRLVSQKAPLAVPEIATAHTTTSTNLGLTLPAHGDTGWGVTLDSDLTLIDTAVGSINTKLANVSSPFVFTGNGSKTASSTGTFTSGDCAKWDANGNVVDAGAPCGSGSGSSGGITAPSTTTVGNIPQYSNGAGTALGAGLGLVVTVGNPGASTNVPSESAVRAAISSALTSSGNMPSQTGNAGYLTTNGTTASWSEISTGPSGALCSGTGCSGGTPGVLDIVTSVVPRLASANTFTGANIFQQFQLTVYTVATLPPCNSSTAGRMQGVSDALSPSYLATVTGGGSVGVPVYCNGTSWVAH